MRLIKSVAPLAGMLLAAAFWSPASARTVTVTLTDKGAAADMPTGLGMDMPGADMSKAPMAITISPATVTAGKVTFDVTNLSKDMVHEMIVAPLGKTPKPLPYKSEDETVDEDAIGSLGEVEERNPSESGTLTLDLKPGKYVLFCNVPGHYTAGMWTMLTVEPTGQMTQ